MYLAQDKTLLARERFTVKLRKPRTMEIFQRCSLCFAQPPVYGGPQTVTNCHIKTKCSHQIQITHSKLKITHSKFKIAHSKLQITHSKLQIVHIKYKSFTSNTRGGYSLIWPIRGCAAGQGMVFGLSVLNRVCGFVRVCPEQGI